MSSWDVSTVAEPAATALTAAAVVVTAAVWSATRAWRPAIPVLLELLLAAGLLRLSATDSWRAIAVAAAIVVVRRVVRSAGATAAGVSGADDAPPSQSGP